jgi:hypothetical protein
VFDPKDRVLVTCVDVFYVGRCVKMVCARCRRDILTRHDIRGTFCCDSMYGGNLDATRCTEDIWTRLDVRGTFGRYSMYGGHLDATRCTGDILPRLDVRGTFGRYSTYGGHFAATRCTGDIRTLLDVRGTFCRDSIYGGHVIVIRYSMDILPRLCAKKFGRIRCARTFRRDSMKNGEGDILTRVDVSAKYLCLTAVVCDGRH